MTMQTIEITDATQPLAEYARRVDTGPIVVTVHGRPIAMVVAVENADLETITLSQSPRFLAIIERSRERQQREGGLASAELRQRLGLPERPT